MQVCVHVHVCLMMGDANELIYMADGLVSVERGLSDYCGCVWQQVSLHPCGQSINGQSPNPQIINAQTPLLGFDTFDLADIYGPAEEITGAYHKQYGPKEGLFYTKVRIIGRSVPFLYACVGGLSSLLVDWMMRWCIILNPSPSLSPHPTQQWVPRPERISRAAAKDAIGRSLQRMDTTRLDLVQFHWVRFCVCVWRGWGWVSISWIECVVFVRAD